MMNHIEKFFKIKERNSTVSTELVAGIVTFLTMSYIIFLQPLIMTGTISGVKTGMDYGAIMTGVCLCAAFGSLLMGLLANYPIALAPGMGENFFFITTFSACASMGIGNPWQTTLGVVLVSGCIFLLLTILKIREMLINAISPSLQQAIGGGIGIFIALLGLKGGGIIQLNPHAGGFVLAGDLKTVTIMIFCAGLFTIAILETLKIKGAILWGILVSTALAVVCGKVQWQGILEAPPSVAPVFAQMDMSSVWQNLSKLLPYIIVFTFMDVFDTIGTLVGVGSQANLMKENKLPGVGKAMTADSVGTVFGTFCGNSTVTCFIESVAGVEYGGRTGLAAVSSAICFLLALFFSPLVKMVGAYPEAGLNPITAPALVIVGAMMMKNAVKIAWDDFSEAVPAFLILLGIPLTQSISDGMFMGFIAYPVIKLCSGKGKDIGWLTYLLAIVLVVYLLFIKVG